MLLPMRSLVLGLVCLALCWRTYADEAATRQIHIKLVDQQNVPIANATAVLRIAAAEHAQDDDLGTLATDSQLKPRPKLVMATSDADGHVTLEFPVTSQALRLRPMPITVWKAGYAMRSVPVTHHATIQLMPAQRRIIRVINAAGQPVTEASVRLVADEPLSSRADWQAECIARTDGLGLASLPGVGPTSRVLIADQEGREFTGYRQPMAMGRAKAAHDSSDLLVFALPATASIEGKFPAELVGKSQPYAYCSQPARAWAAANLVAQPVPRLKVESDGNFRIDNLPVGECWCSLGRRDAYAVDEQVTSQLVAPVQVKLVAGETTNIDLSIRPAAWLKGQVVSQSGPADLSGLQVGLVTQSSSGSLIVGVASARCDAEGQYRLPVMPGSYRVVLLNDRLQQLSEIWTTSDNVQVEIGPGAASVTAAPLKIVRVQPFPVSIDGFNEARVIPEAEPPLLLNFLCTDRSFAASQMGLDGQGVVYMRRDTEVREIRLSRDIGARIFSRMIDSDPSDKFQLAFDPAAQGMDSNVSLEGRVIDLEGGPIADEPIRLTLSYETAEGNDRLRFPVQQRVAAELTSDAEGRLQLPPTQIFRALTLPNELVNAKLKLIFTLEPVQPTTNANSRVEVVTELNRWDQAAIKFPDLTMPRPQPLSTLSGRLVDSQSQPMAGQTVWYSHARSMRRTITDQQGRFTLAKARSPGWFLCEPGWTVRPINDVDQAIELIVGSSTSTSQPNAPTAWPRPGLEERRKLAKTIIDSLNKQPIPTSILPEAAFLEPDKFYDELLLNNRRESDQLRMQFIEFWNDLETDKLARLAAVMQSDELRARVLWILARRKPSVQAYAKVMETIPLPNQEPSRFPQGLPQANMSVRGPDFLLGSVALELYRYGELAPYRDKLQEFIVRTQEQFDKLANGREMSLPPALILCQALLDPQSFAEQVMANLQIPEREITAQERMGLSSSIMTLLRLAPQSIEQLPAARLSFNDELMLELGRLAPNETLRALDSHVMRPDMLRWLVLGAMLQDVPDARQIFLDVHSRLLSETRFPAAFARSTGHTPEFNWVRAASRVSPELGQQAAWQLAYELLRSAQSESSPSILPMMQAREPQLLEMAYAVRDLYPEVARDIVAHELPRLLEQIEAEASRPYPRNFDLSTASYLQPQQTVQLVEQLDKLLAAELKLGPGNRPPFNKIMGLNSLKLTCLKGLLMDELTQVE